MNHVKTQHTTLEAKDLSIGFFAKKKQIPLVENINFNIKSGELIGIIGANGVGKSTLIRTLARMQPKIAGEIYIENQQIDSFSEIIFATKMSVVLTEKPASKNLSVYELVALGRYPYTNSIGHLTKHDLEIIQQALTETETNNLQNKKCYQLSDGQLQRVLIARALAQDTPLILLDEPTTFLDLYHRGFILKLLKKLTQESNKTIILTTHEIDLAIDTCDKLLVITPSKTYYNTPNILINEGVFDLLFPKEIVSFNTETRTFKLKK
jgi:iron complex transport system ATP-binding protein